MDLFPLSVGTANPPALTTSTGARALSSTTALTMGSYDGNAVSTLWDYAQPAP